MIVLLVAAYFVLH
jgi:hypothetical protein